MDVDWSVGVDLMLNAFGETVTYTPYGGAALSITAIVDRQPRSGLSEAGRVVRPRFMVYVANDATTGIDVTTLDRGQDLLAFPDVPGGTVTIWSISRVSVQDEGMLALECA